MSDETEETRADVESDAMPPHEHLAVPSITSAPSFSRDINAPSGALIVQHEGWPCVPGFTILGRLGEGGMGTVWLAVQTSTQRKVALKLMSARAFGSERAVRRFEREVELAAMLEHPNIARVYDSGHHHGAHFYALELIEGTPLDQYAQDRSLNRAGVLMLMQKVCAGVEAAHRHGVIHRDLKPSNVLVSADGEPHVLDFGLAKSMESTAADTLITIEGEIAGTPAYMAPEQAAGRVREIDTRTDVYALGVILFRLLTGRNPHDLSGSQFEVLRRITEEEVVRPRDASHDLDSDLEAILLKALARDRDERYATAGDLGDDLARYLKGDPVAARHATLIYFLRKRVRKHKWAMAATAAVLAAIIGGAIFYVISLGAEQDRTFKAKELADANAKTAQQREREAKQSEANATQQARRATKAEAAATLEAQAARKALYISLIGLAHTRLSEGDLGEARDLLDRCPAEFRNWEYHHLRSRLIDQTQWIVGSGQHVVSILCSFDGSTMATIDSKSEISMYDGPSGRRLRSSRDWDQVRGWTISPDGKTLAIGRPNGEVHLWDHAANTIVHTFASSEHFPNVLKWSDDGRWLAGGTREGSIIVWDMKSRQPAAKLEGGGDGVRSITFRPDGKTLIAGFNVKESSLIEWSIPNAVLLRRFGNQMGGHGFSSVNHSLDGTTIAAMDNGIIHVFDAATGRLRQKRHAPGESGNSLVLSHDGTQAITAGWDRNARVLDLVTDRTVIIHRQSGHNATTTSDGRRLIAYGGTGQPPILPTKPLTGFMDFQNVGGAHFSPDGKRFALCTNDPGPHHTIRIHDVATGQLLRQLQTPWRAYQVTFSQQGDSVYALGGDGHLAAWRIEDGKELFHRQIKPSAGRLWHPTRPLMVIWDTDQKPLLYDLMADQSLPFEGKFDAGSMQGALLSHDGRWMASSDEQSNLLLWDVDQRRLIKTIPTNLKNISEVAPSPDGSHLATSESRGPVRLWHVASGREVAAATDIGTVVALAFSPEGERIFTVGWSQQMRIWDGRTLHSILSLSCGDTVSDTFRISRDGRTLLTGKDGQSLRLWQSSSSQSDENHPLDLLALVDPRLDTTAGQWSRHDSSSLESLLPKERSRLTVPVQIKGSYRLRSRFTYLEKHDSVEFVLPIADQQILLTFGGWPTSEKCSGLSQINWALAPQNETRVSNHQLTAGQSYLADISVRIDGDQAAITVLLDDQPFINWRGPINALNAPEVLKGNRPAALSVMSFARTRFDELELTMLQGTATPLRPAPPVPVSKDQSVASGVTFDLLSPLAIGEPVAKDKWTRDADGLRTNHPAGRTFLPVNITPVGSYRLHAEFTPHAAVNSRSLGIILPAGAGRTFLVLDHVTTATHGLDLVRQVGLGQGSPNPTCIPGQWNAGHRYTMDVLMRLDQQEAVVTVHLDGQRIIRWQGLQSDLGTHYDWDRPTHLQNFAISTSIDATFHKLELEMLDGQAWQYKPAKKSD